SAPKNKIPRPALRDRDGFLESRTPPQICAGTARDFPVHDLHPAKLLSWRAGSVSAERSRDRSGIEDIAAKYPHHPRQIQSVNREDWSVWKGYEKPHSDENRGGRFHRILAAIRAVGLFRRNIVRNNIHHWR